MIEWLKNLVTFFFGTSPSSKVQPTVASKPVANKSVKPATKKAAPKKTKR